MFPSSLSAERLAGKALGRRLELLVLAARQAF